ncbi:MAG TPA: DUF4101 domain-containing protein [Anaerolineae bacterium]|nr:DUF4101 domain-containing protein [Anaerolineae bacterium]
MLPKHKILHNQYRIEATIGRGGFGYVYRARDLLTGNIVAIKELLSYLADRPQIAQRFILEARATMNLTHPAIVHTYHIFQQDNTLYLVMEYLPGGSLADRLKRGPLPPDEAVRIAIILCSALEYAHRHGVIHCDLKPANILFDAQGLPHLADFGIAHLSTSRPRQFRTLTDSILGTVRYMSPEQLKRVRNDPRLDLYALGAVLYEMLAGRPYLDFEDETTPAALIRNMRRIQQESPRPLRSLNPAVPPWLAGVVDRALSKDPDQRFPSARAMRHALKKRKTTPKSKKQEKGKDDGRLTRWQWAVLIGTAVMVVTVFAILLWLAVQIEPGGAPVATTAFAWSTPTPTPTPTLSTQSPGPTDTPTFTPSPPSPSTDMPTSVSANTLPQPTATMLPEDPLIPVMQDVIRRYAELKAVAIGRSHDTSQLPTVLAGEALQEQLNAVRWQRDNGAYYETTLHEIQYKWFQRVDATHTQALIIKHETLLYYPEGWTTPSTKKSCDCTYWVLYTFELREGQWYIIRKQRKK